MRNDIGVVRSRFLAPRYGLINDSVFGWRKDCNWSCVACELGSEAWRWAWRWVRTWKKWGLHKGNWVPELCKLHNKYGQLQLIWQPFELCLISTRGSIPCWWSPWRKGACLLDSCWPCLLPNLQKAWGIHTSFSRNEDILFLWSICMIGPWPRIDIIDTGRK